MSTEMMQRMIAAAATALAAIAKFSHHALAAASGVVVGVTGVSEGVTGAAEGEMDEGSGGAEDELGSSVTILRE